MKNAKQMWIDTRDVFGIDASASVAWRWAGIVGFGLVCFLSGCLFHSFFYHQDIPVEHVTYRVVDDVDLSQLPHESWLRTLSLADWDKCSFRDRMAACQKFYLIHHETKNAEEVRHQAVVLYDALAANASRFDRNANFVSTMTGLFDDLEFTRRERWKKVWGSNNQSPET